MKSKYSRVVIITAAVGLLLITLLGCATSVAHHDATSLRGLAIDYYQDQIMDNLARAKNGQLFLHVNITGLNAQILSKLGGSVNGGQSLADTGTRQVTSKAGTIPQIVHTLGTVATRPFTFTISPERDDTITVNTGPEYGDPFIYDMYLRYLGLQTPGPLIVNSELQPKSGTDTIPDITKSKNILSVGQRLPGEKLVEDVDYVRGTLHHYAEHDYYIPIGYKQAYFDLCVALLGRVITAPGPSDKSAFGETGRTKLYIAPPNSESPTNKALRDIKNQIQMLPQF
jgi:hypothetical protein